MWLSVTIVVVWRAFQAKEGMLLSIMGSVFLWSGASFLLSGATAPTTRTTAP